jgi:hypothetical protein
MCRARRPFQRGRFRDAEAHCAVAALSFLPHPEQCRMGGIHDVVDSNVDHVGVFPMRPTRACARRSCAIERRASHWIKPALPVALFRCSCGLKPRTRLNAALNANGVA